MLGEMMRTEFERRRGELAFLTLLFAVLPGVYLLQLALAAPGTEGERLASARWVASLLTLALAIAAVHWGIGAWATERRGGWVYTLSLPVARLRLFALRYLASLAAFGVAALGLTAVSYAAAAALRLPAGMYVYPGHFIAWTAMLAWVLFTAGFVAGGGTAHPWRWIVLPVVALVTLLIVGSSTRVGAPLAPAALWMIDNPLGPFRFLVESPDLVGY
jgi:hypothetical protein